MSAAVTEKHRQLAFELAAITHDGWRPERIMHALADAEARGREAALRECADAVDARMKRHTYGCDCPAGPTALAIRNAILALLEVPK